MLLRMKMQIEAQRTCLIWADHVSVFEPDNGHSARRFRYDL